MIYRFTTLISEDSDEVFGQVAGKRPDTLSGVNEGQAYIDFSRESGSLGLAIDSAITDLTKLGVGPLGIQVDELAGIA